MLVDRRRLSRERRHSHRVNSVFAVKAVVGSRVLLCQAEDVGLQGMTFRRPKDASFPLNTSLTLIFELPGMSAEGELSVRSEVVTDVRAGGFRRTGIRFTALVPEHGRLIADYCFRHGIDLGDTDISQVA